MIFEEHEGEEEEEENEEKGGGVKISTYMRLLG